MQILGWTLQIKLEQPHMIPLFVFVFICLFLFVFSCSVYLQKRNFIEPECNQFPEGPVSLIALGCPVYNTIQSSL